jgi:exodeoxyribonuclease V alpha subunit
MNMQLSPGKDWFEAGLEAGWVGTYEKEALRFLQKEYGELSEPLQLCVVFLSLFIKAGHTCLPLDKSPQEWVDILGLEPSLKQHFKNDLIRISTLKPDSMIGQKGSMNPMILTGNRLTFRRYWFYENIVRQWIESNSSIKSTTDIKGRSVEVLSDLFPGDSAEQDWQKVAAAMSLVKPFLIISGGPGTGKTTTVARILALHRRLSEGRLYVALAAPTGKAAGRMGEALNRELGKLGLSEEELREFPTEAKTVHRLLSGTESKGLLPPPQKEQLRHDLIIVDEASMMDLSLMYRLISHLGDHTRLILLGDKDQLASVEAGAVFADLCQKRDNGLKLSTIERLHQLGIRQKLPHRRESQVSDSIVYLTKSYRFDPSSGIGQLSQLVKNRHQKNDELESLFSSFDDISHQHFYYSKEDISSLVDDLIQIIKECSVINDDSELLTFWKKSIWLMVLRRGLTGTERMNRLIEEQLASRRVVMMENGWYHGRPIMVTQNDYGLGVFNGDLGVALKEDDGVWVYVETGSEVRRFRPHRLHHYDPAFFLTVHKSQGSEFDHVNLLLPQKDTQILTRELLYTAITRARSRFSLYGDLNLFEKGIGRETLRFTGLREMLYSDSLTDQ